MIWASELVPKLAEITGLPEATIGGVQRRLNRKRYFPVTARIIRSQTRHAPRRDAVAWRDGRCARQRRGSGGNVVLRAYGFQRQQARRFTLQHHRQFQERQRGVGDCVQIPA